MKFETLADESFIPTEAEIGNSPRLVDGDKKTEKLTETNKEEPSTDEHLRVKSFHMSSQGGENSRFVPTIVTLVDEHDGPSNDGTSITTQHSLWCQRHPLHLHLLQWKGWNALEHQLQLLLIMDCQSLQQQDPWRPPDCSLPYLHAAYGKFLGTYVC